MDIWINGGFFVMESGIFDYLQGDMDNIQWEKKPLVDIARRWTTSRIQASRFLEANGCYEG